MDFEKKRKKAEEYAEIYKQKQEIKEIKNKYRKKLTFSKWAFIFMMINCTVIEIFSMIAMFRFMDLSPLPSLIVAVVGECVSLCSYNFKAQAENTANGITYELAMSKGGDNCG